METIDIDLAPIEGRLAAADEITQREGLFYTAQDIRWELESEGTIPEALIDLWVHAQETERTLLDDLKRTREERDAAIADLASIRGRGVPCHICKYVDMIGCCHKNHCGDKNENFKWRGPEKGEDSDD